MPKRPLLTALQGLGLMVALCGIGATITPRTSAAAGYSPDVTEYAIPTPNSGAGGGMALGPDGNVWFTQQNAGSIASITPDGTITEYVTPTANSGPTGLSFDDEGNLWFTEQFVNQMGVMAFDGTFAEYSLSRPGLEWPRVSR